MKNQGAVKSGVETNDDGLSYAIGLNRLLLGPLGVWPLRRNATKSEMIGRKIRILISIWIISCHMIPQYLNILLRERSTEGYLQIVAPQVFDVLAMMKFFVMLLNGEKVRYCVNCIEDDWTNVRLETEMRTMYRNAKVGRYLTIFCAGFMFAGLIPYNVVLPFLNTDPPPTSGNSSSFAPRPLAYPTTYVVFDEQSTPTYEITWIIQFVGSAYLSALNCGVYTLTGILVAHVCGQLQIIGSRLENLMDGNGGESRNVEHRIAAIVQCHVNAIRYSAYVNDSLQVLFLMDELGALTVICFAGYSIITTWSEQNSTVGTTIYVVLMIANVFNFFVISFVGQLLWDKSLEVGIAATRAHWYGLPPNVARSLIMCMIRSAQPLTLSACNMFALSLTNFSDVLRGSFVFLNMVRKLTTID